MDLFVDNYDKINIAVVKSDIVKFDGNQKLRLTRYRKGDKLAGISLGID